MCASEGYIYQGEKMLVMGAESSATPIAMIQPQLHLPNNTSPFPRPYHLPASSTLSPLQNARLDPWPRPRTHSAPKYCEACEFLIRRIEDCQARALLLDHIQRDHRTETMAEEHRIAAVEGLDTSTQAYFKAERPPSPDFPQPNSDGGAFDMSDSGYWSGSQPTPMLSDTYSAYFDGQHHLPQGYPASYTMPVDGVPIYGMDDGNFFMSALSSVSNAEYSPYSLETAPEDVPSRIDSPSAFDFSSTAQPEREVFTPISPFRRTRWVDPAERGATIGPRDVDLCPVPTPLILEGNGSPSPPPALPTISILPEAAGDTAPQVTAFEDMGRQEEHTDRKAARKPLPDSISYRGPPAVPSHGRNSPPRIMPSATRPSTRKKPHPERPRTAASARVARKPIRPAASLPTPPPTPAEENTAAAGPTPDGICPITGHPFLPKNDYLVVAKNFGMTYKEIRARGGFSEAESTLRGRYRNLTKRSDERVRRPVWRRDDIKLLKEAVRRLSSGAHPDEGKFTWKQVAEYIANNGGSYRFGNATCSKKWEELRMSGSLSP